MTEKERRAIVRMADKQTMAHVRAMTSTFRDLKMPEKDVQKNVRLFWKNEAKARGVIT